MDLNDALQFRNDPPRRQCVQVLFRCALFPPPFFPELFHLFLLPLSVSDVCARDGHDGQVFLSLNV